MISKRLARALISLRVCAGWSEPLLVAHITLLKISCHGSYCHDYGFQWVDNSDHSIYIGKITSNFCGPNKAPNYLQSPFKVSKDAKIRNRYHQVPHLTQDTNGQVTNSQLDILNESQEVSLFPAACPQGKNKQTRTT